jgi:hypothetical protein
MADMTGLGYSDTPIIPESTWHVHDGDRPQPRLVTPGTCGTPPSDAIVLFDGSSLDGWAGRDGDAAWKLEDDYMEVIPKTGNIKSKAELGDCQLHLEFAAPDVVKGDGQGRGNSGVFLMGRYEIQVLDGYDNPTYADGATGGIYGQFPPLVNACRKPGEWSVYNIIWTGPRFEGETVVREAQVTVMLNGIVVQNARVLQGPTEHRQLATYKPHAEAGSLELQDHGDLVRFRNIWYRPL